MITPRMSVSITDLNKKRLYKVLTKLNIKSPGQLFEMLLSGDEKVIDWIMDEFKRVNNLF